jgi:hypothetical protein
VQLLYYLTSGVTFGLCWCRHSLAARQVDVTEVEKVREYASGSNRP